jgi:hypothetical protein
MLKLGDSEDAESLKEVGIGVILQVLRTDNPVMKENVSVLCGF